ncbi:MAG: sulfur carrier protein ThiS [Bryobacter sp.]|nr:sulfur carrier protein ThiS [Bryobacter sp.]
MISILVNGQSREVPAGKTLAELLVWLEVPADRVAVELNKEIVRRTAWPSTSVAAGSELEIVMFVGGG